VDARGIRKEDIMRRNGVHTVHLNESLPLCIVARPIVIWSRDRSPRRRSVLDVHRGHQAERGGMALIRQVNWVSEELDGFDV